MPVSLGSFHEAGGNKKWLRIQICVSELAESKYFRIFDLMWVIFYAHLIFYHFCLFLIAKKSEEMLKKTMYQIL